MKPAPFEYFAPRTLDEALSLLASHDGEGRVLAGGQSLVPAMNFRLATPEAVIDLNRIDGHDGVRVEGDELSIGMLARHADLEHVELDDGLGDLLSATARFVGHLPIRVRGTFAGSLAHADPAAEWSMLALALDAAIVATSVRGQRRIGAADFFEGPFTTALAPDEIITEVRLPMLGRAGYSVIEKSRTAGDFALVAALATVRVEDGAVGEARIALAGVEGRPVRPVEAETELAGAPVTSENLDAAARLAADAVDPISDTSCSAEYRRHLVRVLTRRALEQAAQRAPR
jgi:aerobic carbon-monoxide dehydrogenase medium subunit